MNRCDSIRGYRGNEEVNVFLKEYSYCKGNIKYIICAIVPLENTDQKILERLRVKNLQSGNVLISQNDLINCILLCYLKTCSRRPN